jgi:NAD-dependent DNA ligase
MLSIQELFPDQSDIAYEDLDRHHATRWQRKTQQISTLLGIVEGITIDKVVCDRERQYLQQWMEEHRHEAKILGYDRVFDLILDRLRSGFSSSIEQAELIKLIESFDQNAFYKQDTLAIEEFQGILAGIAADRVITVDELRPLEDWIEEHEDLRNRYPITEIEAIVTSVLTDGVIDKQEHAMLVQWFSSFLKAQDKNTLENPDGFSMGVLAQNVDIKIPGKSFCITGGSPRLKRQELHDILTDLGATIKDGVHMNLDYLVYCQNGSKCYAYECYGRKIEAAMEYRRSGKSDVLIISEKDFFDALAGHGITIPQ